jgi:hypothetical protein
MTNKPITSPGIVNTVRYLFKEIKLACNSVMTIENSPLKNLDPMAAHVVFQSLAFVWSAIFASMLGSMMAFGISAVFHILLISGIVITAMTFREANKNPEAFNKLLSSGRKYNGRAADGEHV